LRRFIRLPQRFHVGPDAHARLARLPDVSASASNRAGHRADWRSLHARAIARHPHPYHCFHGCNISYGRLEALEVGGWCESFDGAWGYEDVDFGARLHAAGVPIVWVPEALALHLEGNVGVAEARRAGADRNLALVLDRVPGYGAFRRSSSREPAHDGRLLAEEAPVDHEVPLRPEQLSDLLVRPFAIGRGALAPAREGLVLRDEEGDQLAAPRAQVVDDGDGHVGPLGQQDVVEDDDTAGLERLVCDPRVVANPVVGVAAIDVYEPRVGAEVGGGQLQRVATPHDERRQIADDVGPSPPQAVLGRARRAEAPAGDVVPADLEGVAGDEVLPRRQRPPEHQGRTTVVHPDLGDVASQLVGDLPASEAVEQPCGGGREEPGNILQAVDRKRPHRLVTSPNGREAHASARPDPHATPSLWLLVPPAGPGSLGDEGMLRGALEALRPRGGRVALARADPGPGYELTGYDVEDLALEPALRRVEREGRTGGAPAVVVLGADVLDGFYGDEPVEGRVDLLMRAARA
jgi:hypothetical protein